MTRGQTLVAISLAAVATASSIVINLATEYKTKIWAWIAVGVLLIITILLSLYERRRMPTDAGASEKGSAVSRIITSKADTRFLRSGTETAHTEAIGVELEYIVERPGGKRTYMRAYSIDAAKILAESRNQGLDTDERV